jgi:hypothetical protein
MLKFAERTGFGAVIVVWSFLSSHSRKSNHCCAHDKPPFLSFRLLLLLSSSPAVRWWNVSSVLRAHGQKKEHSIRSICRLATTTSFRSNRRRQLGLLAFQQNDEDTNSWSSAPRPTVSPALVMVNIVVIAVIVAVAVVVAIVPKLVVHDDQDDDENDTSVAAVTARPPDSGGLSSRGSKELFRPTKEAPFVVVSSFLCSSSSSSSSL